MGVARRLPGGDRTCVRPPAADPSPTQIWPSPAERGRKRAKSSKIFALDFLGFSRPVRAFSKTCAEPPGKKILSPAARQKSHRKLRMHARAPRLSPPRLFLRVGS